MKSHIDLNLYDLDPDHFWPMVDKSGDGCWEFTKALNTTGYGIYKHILSENDRKTSNRRDIGLSAHRVAFYLENGTIDKDLLVCHTCDNRKCCRPSHLFQGTQADNMQDFSVKHHSGNKKRYDLPERTGKRSSGIKKWRKIRK